MCVQSGVHSNNNLNTVRSETKDNTENKKGDLKGRVLRVIKPLLGGVGLICLGTVMLATAIALSSLPSPINPLLHAIALVTMFTSPVPVISGVNVLVNTLSSKAFADLF